MYSITQILDRLSSIFILKQLNFEAVKNLQNTAVLVGKLWKIGGS
jgi:hypothetical protein